MKTLPILCFLIICSNLKAQTNWEHFKKQSPPIKMWVLLHSFKAEKAHKISLEVQKISDSIVKTNLLDKDASGGQVDAFRHAFWMAMLQSEIGKCAAKSLGKAYERANYKSFKKRKLENGILPDKPAMKMDLYNNKVGLKFSKKGDSISAKSLIYKISNAILRGDLMVLKKDSLGNYLTCNNEIIPKEELLHKWKNNKCLVSSNLLE